MTPITKNLITKEIPEACRKITRPFQKITSSSGRINGSVTVFHQTHEEKINALVKTAELPSNTSEKLKNSILEFRDSYRVLKAFVMGVESFTKVFREFYDKAIRGFSLFGSLGEKIQGSQLQSLFSKHILKPNFLGDKKTLDDLLKTLVANLKVNFSKIIYEASRKRNYAVTRLIDSFELSFDDLAKSAESLATKASSLLKLKDFSDIRVKRKDLSFSFENFVKQIGNQIHLPFQRLFLKMLLEREDGLDDEHIVNKLKKSLGLLETQIAEAGVDLDSFDFKLLRAK